jgi:hypothetical protein
MYPSANFKLVPASPNDDGREKGGDPEAGSGRNHIATRNITNNVNSCLWCLSSLFLCRHVPTPTILNTLTDCTVDYCSNASLIWNILYIHEQAVRDSAVALSVSGAVSRRIIISSMTWWMFFSHFLEQGLVMTNSTANRQCID